MISKKSKIFVAGHKGMVGSAIIRKLKRKGFSKIIFADKKKLNLLDQDKVFKFLKKIKPELVIIAAARVGGIQANSNFKQKFIYENLQIQNNLIHGSFLAKVKNLIFLGSSCIYPKFCEQPILENFLLSGNCFLRATDGLNEYRSSTSITLSFRSIANVYIKSSFFGLNHSTEDG